MSEPRCFAWVARRHWEIGGAGQCRYRGTVKGRDGQWRCRLHAALNKEAK